MINGPLTNRGQASVIDQRYQPSADLGANINVGYSYIAQVVTAGKQGYLARADLNVSIFQDFSFADWLVTVNAVQAGVPTGTVLATQLVPVNQLTSLEVDFSSPAYFHSGDSFALVISAFGLPAHEDAGNWSGSFTPYSGGGIAYESTNGSSFASISVPAGALGFDTYVQVPEPLSSFTPLGAMVLLFATARRRRRLVAGS